MVHLRFKLKFIYLKKYITKHFIYNKKKEFLQNRFKNLGVENTIERRGKFNNISHNLVLSDYKRSVK